MLVSVTTAKITLKQTLLLIINCTNTFMLWMILVAWIGWVTVLLHCSKVDPLTVKHFNWQSLLILFYFLCTPLSLACSLWFNLFGILVFLMSQPYPTRFTWNLSYPLHYAYSKSTAIFRLILLLNITTENTLHSRVKDPITHNSIVI